MKKRSNPPELWVGPIKINSDMYEVWMSVPHMIGEIRRKRGRWYAPDGRQFLNSNEAAEYMYDLVRLKQQEFSPTTKPLMPTPKAERSATPPPPPPANTAKKATKDMTKEELVAAFEDLSESIKHLKGMFQRGD